MGENYTLALVRQLKAAGCRLVRRGKGDHDSWESPISGRRFPVDARSSPVGMGLSRALSTGLIGDLAGDAVQGAVERLKDHLTIDGRDLAAASRTASAGSPAPSRSACPPNVPVS